MFCCSSKTQNNILASESLCRDESCEEQHLVLMRTKVLVNTMRVFVYITAMHVDQPYCLYLVYRKGPFIFFTLHSHINGASAASLNQHILFISKYTINIRTSVL